MYTSRSHQNHMPTHPYIGYPKRKRNEILNPYDATLRVWKQEKRIENNKRKYVKKKKRCKVGSACGYHREKKQLFFAIRPHRGRSISKISVPLSYIPNFSHRQNISYISNSTSGCFPHFLPSFHDGLRSLFHGRSLVTNCSNGSF